MTTPAARRRAGFSLIELLVSMAIGLVLTLAISSVLIQSERDKRSTSSVNDINQSGAYAAYVLDRVIRSAGSGYAQRWREVFGCPLVSAKSGVALNFRSSAWTDAGYTGQTWALAPVLIGKDQANKPGDARGDLITVMAGTSGYAEAPQAIVSTLTVSPPQINLSNVIGYSSDDLVLLASPNVSAGCMVEQIGTPTSGGALPLPLASDYYNPAGTGSGGSVSLSSFNTGSYLIQLGSANPIRNNPPEFITFGVTDNRVLSAYDLLNVTSPAMSDIGDGVVEMHALYGIDSLTGSTGQVAQWIDPVAGSGYDVATLLGATDKRDRLHNIIAIRIGLILRTSTPEKDPVRQPQSLTLFADLPGGVTRIRPLDPSEVNYRFRTIEITVPLRNLVLAQ